MRLTEEEIRKITLSAIQELGDKATPDSVRDVVSKAVGSVESTANYTKLPDTQSGKIILTSFGGNHPGIVAGITKTLSETGCNILDISQKILTEYYTMIMVIDVSEASCSLKELQDKMNSVADEMRIKIYLQHEDIFKSMHRI